MTAQGFPATLETPRLLARLPRASDAAQLFATYTQDAAVTRYLQWQPHQSVAETEAFIAECLLAIGRGTRYPYVLATREHPDAPIGMLEAQPASHTVQLGYVLARTHWGRGYMPEAVLGLVDWILAQSRFSLVLAYCDVDNQPSRRTLEKAGFVLKGRHERHGVHPNIGPEPRPCYLYERCR